MSEIINKNKYLDYAGLKKYDGLIKSFIASGDQKLADAIAALDAKLGSLEFDGSDDKSFAEVINELYAEIAGLDAKDTELEGKINSIIGDLESLEGSTLADIVNKVNANTEAIETLNGEGEGSVKKAAAAAQAAAEETAAADATSKADAALASAKEYVDGLVKDEEGNVLFDAAGTAAGLDAAMDARVKVLEAIDHEQLTADAVAAVVAGAESDFDTLKEVADWIAADKEGSAALQITVSEHTDSINTINSDIDTLEARVDGDIANLTTHMSEAATALAEVDGRLDALEAFEETHASIEISEIEGLFA